MEKSAEQNQTTNKILTLPLLQVIIAISAPIAIYNGFNFIYGLIDSLIVARISSTAVSSVAYLEQIRSAIAAIGTGLAAGGSIIAARYLGAGALEKARKTAATLFMMTAVLVFIMLVITLPLIIPILKLANTPEDLIMVGSGYFTIQMLTLGVVFFNNTFIGLQKAKGSSRSILGYNLIVMATKISLSLLFVFGLGINDVMILAVATLLAQLVLFGIGLAHLLNKRYTFAFSWRDVQFSRKALLSIIFLSLPIFLGRFVFSIGKVIVNAISADYGSQVVGGLSISNTLNGTVTSVCNSVEEAESTIVSQNIGHQNLKRGLDTFLISTLISVGISLVGFILITIFRQPLANLYDNGEAVYTYQQNKIQVALTFNYDEILLRADLGNAPTPFNELVQSTWIGKPLNELKDLNANLDPQVYGENAALYRIAIDDIFGRVLVDYQFSDTVITILNYERWGVLLLAFSSATLGFLYGLGYTKLALVLNLFRLFVFRVPSLLILRAVVTMPIGAEARIAAGAHAVGQAMMVSNVGIGFTAIVIGVFVYRHLKRGKFHDRILENEA